MKTKQLGLLKKYPYKATPHFLSKMKNSSPGLMKQIEPSGEEISSSGMQDPLAEEHNSPIPGLVHRYPHRVLFLTTNNCFAYCRFCTRKRNWEKSSRFTENFPRIISYLNKHKEINEVILSGGDPLTLPPIQLSKIICALKKIKTVKVMRISTRVLSFAPERITEEACKRLEQFNPLYFMTHFNHPDEINSKVLKAIQLLRKHDIILLNQSVLLKKINDDIKTLENLSRKLMESGVVPYALHQLDYTESVQHFKVSEKKGKKLIEEMRKNFSGIGIPHYVLDQKKGRGKKFITV